MPILGLGVHFLIALFFAIHAIRTGREMYWLFVLFTFPLLGSAVYFAAVFLPHSRLERSLLQAGHKLGRVIDPGRELREAQDAFDLTPTAHNQMQLARAMYNADQFEQAVAQFDACLRGPFASDPDIRLGAAMANLAAGRADAAVFLLQALRSGSPDFRAEQVGVLLAKAYAQLGRAAEASAEFESVVSRFDSVEARGEYVLWALKSGRSDAARRELVVLDARRKHMNRATRDRYHGLFRAVDAARAQIEGPGR